MIWLKRLAPLVVIAAIWFGYKQFQSGKQARLETAMRQKATIVAHLWYASARYRANPARYETFRDSLLDANNLSKEDLFAFTQQFQNDPEANVVMMNLVSAAVDSLYPHEDTLWRASSREAIKKPALDTLLNDSARLKSVDTAR
ncbi:MAG: hypothetical protein AB1644_12965 [Candidatus Zixiibacteriota bacterium]